MKQEDVLLLLQRVLVQLGGVSQTIIQEYRRIAWGQVSPANTLPDEPEGSNPIWRRFFGEGNQAY